MDIKIQLKGQVLVAELCGRADALEGEPGSVLKVFRRIDELVGSVRPSRVQIDFCGLTAMEAGAFRQIAGEVAWLSRRVTVELVGPGTAMERFFTHQAPPPWWRWEEVDPPVDEERRGSEASTGAPAGSGPAQEFEIDLDREELLRQGEPPLPAFNPMAEPLDLLSEPSPPVPKGKFPSPSVPKGKFPSPSVPKGKFPSPSVPKGEFPGEAGREPHADETQLIVEEPAEIPAAPDREFAVEDLQLPPDLGGRSFAVETGPIREDVGSDPRAFDGSRADSAGTAPVEEISWPADGDLAVPDFAVRDFAVRDFSAPPAPMPSEYGGDPIPARQREEFLKARLVASLLSEDALRGRLAELEAQLLVLGRRLARERAERKAAAPAAAARDRRPPPPASIPRFLEGHFPRGDLVAAAGRLLEMRSGTEEVSGDAILDLASRLAVAVERAPYAGFDFSQARTGGPPAARVVSVTASALCMLSSSGASRERLRRLALAALLQCLGPGGGDAYRLLGEEGPSKALAGRLNRRLSLLLRQAGEPGMVEEEVLGCLQLLELMSSFWRRIGPPPEGGAEPAAAAAAVAREEIGREVPVRLRRLFLEAFSAFPPGSWVRLESGETGVVVGPGSKDLRGPLVLSLLSGGEREARARPPRLVDTGAEPGTRVRSVVACPLPACPAPRQLLRIGTGFALRSGEPE